MRKELIAVVGLFCVVPLLAQSFNTICYAPNGGYGGSVQATRNGNSTRMTFNNQNGLYDGVPLPLGPALMLSRNCHG